MKKWRQDGDSFQSKHLCKTSTNTLTCISTTSRARALSCRQRRGLHIEELHLVAHRPPPRGARLVDRRSPPSPSPASNLDRVDESACERKAETSFFPWPSCRRQKDGIHGRGASEITNKERSDLAAFPRLHESHPILHYKLDLGAHVGTFHGMASRGAGREGSDLQS